MAEPTVGVVMGSDSDLVVMSQATEVLAELGDGPCLLAVALAVLLVFVAAASAHAATLHALAGLH